MDRGICWSTVFLLIYVLISWGRANSVEPTELVNQGIATGPVWDSDCERVPCKTLPYSAYETDAVARGPIPPGPTQESGCCMLGLSCCRF